MFDVTINYLAVLASAVFNMVLGALWYSPMLFGNLWAKKMGKPIEEMKGKEKTGYGVAAVAALVMAYVLAHVVNYAGASTIADGAITGAWVWLGFVATIGAVGAAFGGRSIKMFAVDYGYHLIVLAVSGAILAVWV